MDERFQKGVEHFNRREYFEAHEVWEEIWMEESGPRHAFLQGLIQVAVALHHASRENFKGTRKLFASALNYLEKGKPDSEPVSMDLLVDRILSFELALQRRLSENSQEALPYFELPVKSE